MKQPFKTRPVQEDDRDSLIALLGKSYFGSDTFSDHEDRKLAEGRADNQIGSSLDPQSGKKLFLAVAGDKAVGFSYVITDERRGGYLVDDLHTLKEYEGNGIASALLKNCENFVKKCGESDIHLSVVADNKPLVDYYTKRGWLKQTFFDAENSESKTEIDPQNARVATHLMKKTL